jgi:sugar/nucleoside kinase (ribokinase family)
VGRGNPDCSDSTESAKVPDDKGLDWLGCGDNFRAGFINRMLRGETDPLATRLAAAGAAAEEIMRMAFLADW